jgi:hypothetical protein
MKKLNRRSAPLDASHKMNHDEFEQRLRRQPIRPIPGDWRADILAAARAAQPGESPVAIHRSWLAILNQQLSTLLWPHPRAWAGVTAVWVVIFVLHLAARDTDGPGREMASPSSPEITAELRQQQRMFAELMGTAEAQDADRPKGSPARPRTERSGFLMT